MSELSPSMANPIDLTGLLHGCQLDARRSMQANKNTQRGGNNLTLTALKSNSDCFCVCMYTNVSVCMCETIRQILRETRRQRDLTSGRLRWKRGGEASGCRAEGPGQFNGAFVCAVRPPALTGCCRKKKLTNMQTHILLPSFHISSPSLYLFHCSGLQPQLPSDPKRSVMNLQKRTDIMAQTCRIDSGHLTLFVFPRDFRFLLVFPCRTSMSTLGTALMEY